ncbi:REP-associated tyrosine transposase [Zobellella maritima]|uniref:REP-associated tyrosine transposase n=1 Tax=Zobellella maritima TaxID=2059725 RepID=UPI000E30573E|nr:transposase [Zobellella maritima]
MKGTSSHLRKGRCSESGQVYMVTTITMDRIRYFSDFYMARTLIRILHESETRGHCQMLAFVVMPDHLHWLLRLQDDSLSRLIGRIKSLSARQVGRRIWQDGFHDHGVRSDEDLRSLARYIVANPVRAGLVKNVGQYPHWDAIWL